MKFRLIKLAILCCVLINIILPVNMICSAEENTSTELLAAYKVQLSQFENEKIKGLTSDTKYYVYDIDKNNIPELIIHHGTCEADYYYTVHTFENNSSKYIGKFPGGHDALAGWQSKGLLWHMSHMDCEYIWCYTIENNELVKKELYNENGEYKYYKNISDFQEGAEWLKYASITDYSLLEEYVKNHPTETAPEIKVNVNGERIEFDQPPILKNDRTFVPIRYIAENLGADVSWDEKTRLVTICSDKGKIELITEWAEANINGVKTIIDAVPFVENGRTLVPVRFVAQALGANVSWDDENKCVNIENENYVDENNYAEYVSDSDLPIVFTTEKANDGRDISIPELNLKDTGIMDMFKEKITSNLKYTTEYPRTISYTYSICNDIVSVVASYSDGNGSDQRYYTFNFNIKTGEEIDFSNLCEMIRLSKTDYINTVREKCMSAFDVRNPISNNNWVSEEFYNEQRNKAGSDKCFSDSSQWFIGQGGTVNVIVCMPGIDGGDYIYAVDTGIFLP